MRAKRVEVSKLLSSYKKYVLSHSENPHPDPVFALAPSWSHIETQLSQIQQLVDCGRAAKGTWNSDWERGVSSFIRAFEMLDNLHNDIQSYLSPQIDAAFLIHEERLWNMVIEPDISPDEQSQRRRVYFHAIKAFAGENNMPIKLPDNIAAEYDPQFDEVRGKIENLKSSCRITEGSARSRIENTEVILSKDYKIEIHNLLNEIRVIVANADLAADKRDAVMDKINALAAEVDRHATKYKAYLRMWDDLCGAVGRGAEKIKPAVDRAKEIASIFGLARGESQPQLPGSHEVRRLTSPNGNGE